MGDVLSYLVIGAVAAVVVVLLVGVASMAFGGTFNQKYGNKLMRLRIGLQILAIVAIAAAFFYARG
jgi:Hypoxia induced protein conserved region